MGEQTKIEWCDHTFNPWRGCSKVRGHVGCAHCYAERDMSVRLHGIKWGPRGTRVVASPSYWKQPMKWNRDGERRRVFCGSLCDVFEPWTGEMLDSRGNKLRRDHQEGTTGLRPMTMQDSRSDLFDVIDRTPNLDWLVLTKRPHNVRSMWPREQGSPTLRKLDNVWLGVSVSDQATADEYIPQLLTLRHLVPVLFVSAEPLLGPIDLTTTCINLPAETMGLGGPYMADGDAGVDWVIIGGESETRGGPKARPCHLDWIRNIKDQCAEASVTVFVKQIGSRPTDFDDGGIDGNEMHNCPYLCLDKKGGDPDEWPEELRVREFPQWNSIPGG